MRVLINSASIALIRGIMKEELQNMDGLKEDLEQAVRVAFDRGATEWTRLNYPDLYARWTTPTQENG